MCLTVPQKVIDVKGNTAVMQDGRRVMTVLVGNVQPGDILLVQANMAVEKVSQSQLRKMKQLMETEIE
jgi:hydrogenase maturation factor